MIVDNGHVSTDARLDAGSPASVHPLLELAGLVRGRRGLEEVLEGIAGTIADGLGWHGVVVHLYRPAWDDFEVTTVRGTAREGRGATTTWRDWRSLLDSESDARAAFVRDEGIVLPLAHSDGHLIGILSVRGRSEPAGESEIDVLRAAAAQAAQAIELAQDDAENARHRAALEHLHEVSTRLSVASSAEAALEAVAAGIARALDFEKACVLVRDGDGFVPVAVSGWSLDDREVNIRLSTSAVERLFEPRFEIEGCYLLARNDALERCSSGSDYASVLNGRGPWAWNRHWLLAPLRDEAGDLLGVVWLDDPGDRLLPSREKLRVLRMFANHAATALELKRTWESEHRRNRELEALYDTTLDVVEKLDREHVLEAVVGRACDLLGTPDGYAYLVEDEHLVLALGSGVFSDFIGLRLERGEGLAGQIWEQGRALSVASYQTWTSRAEAFAGAGFNAVVGVPLRSNGHFIGVLGVGHVPGRQFAPEELALLEQFGHLASLALDNARLFDETLRSKELYGRVLETSTDSMTLFDLDGTIRFASRATETIFGWKPEELVGRNFVELTHPDDLQAANETIQEAIASGASRAQTARMLHKAGHYVLVEGKPAVIRNARGEPEMILGLARDLTDRIENEQRRRELEAQLRQSQKLEAVGSLAGGIAHDFNNLLTAIAGYGGLALTSVPEDTPELRRDIEEVLAATERARQLIRQLLAFSRKQVLQPTVLDLNEVVQEMESMLRRVIDDNVLLVTALAPDLGHTNADRGQIEQVLMNLCINARDAMTGGGKLVVETFNADLDEEFAEMHVGARPGAYVAVRVADEGHGMTEEVRARLFEPFFTTKEPTKGTGLGLSTVYGIVKQSGGYVWCDSEPGEGATFTVYLPRFGEPVEEDAPEAVAPDTVRDAETVLLAEDEQVVRRLVQQTLERLGYTVVPASSAAEALEQLDANQGAFDLLLTDVVMPGMNGRELATIVKERCPETRVLFMSGYDEDAVAGQGVLRSTAPLLEKPFSAAALGEKVRAVLDA